MTSRAPTEPLTPAEAARELGCGIKTLAAMRKAGEIPYINIGRGGKRETPRYDPADIAAWKEKRKKVSCPSTSAETRKEASIPTNSGFTVADFQEALDARRAAKRKP